MTTPAPPATLPRKHLHTFPHGTALPDPTTVEDGYPFLLEAGASPNVTRTLYQNQNGVWKVVSAAGGGGGVSVGPLVPVPVGKNGRNPDWWATPQSSQAVAPSISGSGTVVAAVAPPGVDPAGVALSATVFQSRAISAGDDDNFVFTINAPSDNSGADPNLPNSPGQRAFRLDFRLSSTYTGSGGMNVAIFCDAFPYDYVYRNANGWSAVDQANAFQGQLPTDPPTDPNYRFYGGKADTSDYYGPLFWAEDRLDNSWRDISLSFPAGTSRVYVVVWADTRVTGTEHLLMTDVRGTYLDTSVPDGTVFLEESTQALWLFDKKLLFANKAQQDAAAANPTAAQGFAGSGWYRMTRGNIVSVKGGNEFDPQGVDQDVIHLGYHRFSDLSDLSGLKFGAARYTKVRYDFTGSIPAAGTQPAFEDNYIRPDATVTDYQTDSYVGTQASPYTVATPGHIAAPGQPVLVVQADNSTLAGTVFNGTTAFTYAWSFDQDFGSSAHLETLLGQGASQTPTAGQLVGITAPDHRTSGATGATLYRSADNGATYTKLVKATFHDANDITLDDARFFHYYNNQTARYVINDRGFTASGSAAPSTDTSTDVALQHTGLSWFKVGAGRSIVMLQSLPTSQMTIEADDHVGFNVQQGGDAAQFWFRSDGTDQNGYYIEVFYSGDPFKARLHNVVNGVDTVLATTAAALSFNAYLSGIRITVDNSVSPATVTMGVRGSGDDEDISAAITTHGNAFTAQPLTTDHDAATFWGVRLPFGAALRRWRMRDYASPTTTPHHLTRLHRGEGVPYVTVPSSLGTNVGSKLSEYSIELARPPRNSSPEARLAIVRRDLGGPGRYYLAASDGSVNFGKLNQVGQLFNTSRDGDPTATYAAGDTLELWLVTTSEHESSQPWLEPAPLPVIAAITFGD